MIVVDALPIRGALVLLSALSVTSCAPPRPVPSTAPISSSKVTPSTIAMNTNAPGRERISLDRGWHFAFGHPHDTSKDHGHATAYFSYQAKAGYGDGPAARDFDDRGWRELDLPHDWAVELPFAANAGHSHGYKTVGRDFPETSVGWYRKKVFIPEADLGRRISVEFEGVFRDSAVFVNGFFLGREPSGYLGFRYDIGDYLNYGGENLIAVRADATLEEGWFYEGAGIYRHVWLTKTAPLYITSDGTFVSAEVENGSAQIAVRTVVANQGMQKAAFEIEHVVLDARRQPIAQSPAREHTLPPGESAELASLLALEKPALWSLEAPTLHALVTTISTKGVVVDRTETAFGIRSVKFDPDHGFFLNGKHVLLKGTNNHQDHAGVGTAVPDALWDFRIRTLKSMGSNAYRCSHHPPAPALLDACDRLGMLVIDETRLMSSSPEKTGELERMIRRDRNHPSVVLWSLGNEEWAIEGNEKGARIATTMQAVARRLDPTRRTTIAISGGWGQGISTVVDVMGYNYIAHGSTDEQHARFPQQPGVGTEETTTLSTRGVYVTDTARAHSAPVANGPSGGNAELGWQHYAARPYLAGLFYWTGFDYRGESNPYGFPAISSQFGILDTCGFPKDGYYYLKSWWTEEPVLHVFPHWTWPGREGQPVDVTAFSNAESVELWLNGTSLGRKQVPKNGHLGWQVTYAPGRLLARSYRQDRELASQRVETTTVPHTLRLSTDRTELAADGADVAVVSVSALDQEGRAVPTADNAVAFTVSGPARILGVGNGDPSSHEADRVVATPRIIEIGNFREHPLEGLGERQVAPRFDDSRWSTAFGKPKEGKPPAVSRVLRARFERPERPSGGTMRLLLRHFGDEQSVFVNGKRIASFSRRQETKRPEIELPESLLQRGQNLLAIIATPYPDDRAREAADQGRPAVLRIDAPAPPWKRSLFNGLAQVILQSTGQPGEIILGAASRGLNEARLTVPVRIRPQAIPRP